MSPRVSSTKGFHSSSGSKGVIEVPRSIVKLSENMKRHILNNSTLEDTKQKREVLEGAITDLHKREGELARENDFIERILHELGERNAQLYKELEVTCKAFTDKVAGIKEDLEKKGFHDLDGTSDEIKAHKDPRKGGH